MNNPPLNLETKLLSASSQGVGISVANTQTQDTSKKISAEGDDDLYYSVNSPVIDLNFHARRDTEARELHIEILKSQNIFPIFKNNALAKFSVNYFFYFEFYRMAIRMLFGTFLFSAICQTILYIIMRFTPSEQTVGFNTLVFIGSSTGASLVLTLLRHFEEKRLLDNPVVYEHQWTEDLFSLLVEGLPRYITNEEIIEHFNTFLTKKLIVGRVRSVITLQDYSSYNRLKRALSALDAKINKLTEKDDPEGKYLSLLKERREVLQSQLDELRDELIDCRHFKGKAIVIFEYIGAKSAVEDYFDNNVFKRFLIFCLRGRYKDHYLHKCRITMKALPEPDNLLFDNLHYSWANRAFRVIIAYMLSSLTMVISLGILAHWQIEKYTLTHEKSSLNFEEKKVTIMYTIFIVVLKSISEIAYKKIKGLMIYPSSLESDLTRINFNIYLSILLYFLLQLAPAFDPDVDWALQLAKMSALYLLTKVIGSGFYILVVFIATKKPPVKDSKALKHRIFEKIVLKCKRFDFIKGISQAIPMIFTAFAYVSLRPIILLPTLFVILYLLAIVDKYRMVRFCDVLTLRSPKYMLVPFKVFRWTLFLSTFGGSCVALYLEVYNKIDLSSGTISPALSQIMGAITTAAFLYWPATLYDQSKVSFNKKHAKTDYDSVCKNFSSLYRKLDPYKEFRSLRFSSSSIQGYVYYI